VHLVLAEGSNYVGAFEVRNTGPGPLTINRVYVAGADDDPRSAPGVSAIGEGNTRAAIPPGGSRRYNVTWRSDQARANRLYATIVIDSDAAQPDATVVDPPKLIGIVANRSLGLARYLMSQLIFVPLLLVVLAGVSRFSRAIDARALRLAAVGVGVFEFGMMVWALAAFDPEFAKRDGNEGLQFAEHFILDRANGIEYFVGLDGWSFALIFIVAALLPLAVATLDPGARGLRRRVAALGLLGTSAVLALGAQTLPLFTLGLAGSGAAAALLAWGEDRNARNAAIQIAVATTVSAGFLIAATVLIGKFAGATYLVDGSDAMRTYGYADIARSKLVQHVEPLGGLPAYRMLWLLTFAGLAPFLPMIPFHGWTRAAVTTKAREVTLAPVVLPALAGYGLLRLGIAMQPDGARWAAESMPWVGAAITLWFALVAIAEPDLRRAASSLLMGRIGLMFLFAFALTPEGIDAALAMVIVQPIAAALLFVSATGIVERIGENKVSELRGIGRSAPLLATGLVVGAIGLSAPILPAALVGLIGSFGRNPVLTLAAAIGAAIAIFAGVRLSRIAFGRQPETWSTSKYLEPFGGAPPDARMEEIPWVAVLLAFAVLTAFVPRVFLGGAEQPIRELWPHLDPPGPTQVI